MLRALGGSSTLVVVGPRFTIGRAPDADLQLLDPHVSRRHARIEYDERGDAVLVDLASTSGTLVGDQRIDRHVLRDGDLIRVAGVMLRYEDVGDPPRAQRPTVDRGIRALRPTLRLDAGGPELALVRDVPRMAAPEPIIAPIEPIVMPCEPAATDSGLVVPPLSTRAIATPGVNGSAARSTTRARAAQRWTPSAVDPEAVSGTRTMQYVPQMPDDERFVHEMLADDDDEAASAPPATKELIRDVFHYRTLRMRAVRGEPLPRESADRLRELDERMHRHSVTQRALDHLRRYHRFACDVPAWLGSLSGRSVSTLAVELKDVGAGGAQVSCPERRFQVGDPCWLVVDLEHEDEGPLVVFRARVAWNAPQQLRMGLAFSGAAHCGADVHELIRRDV